MNNHPHHDSQHIKHPSNIGSFLFHHIIMHTNPFASYSITKPHFDKVRIFSQNRLFFNFSQQK